MVGLAAAGTTHHKGQSHFASCLLIRPSLCIDGPPNMRNEILAYRLRTLPASTGW